MILSVLLTILIIIIVWRGVRLKIEIDL